MDNWEEGGGRGLFDEDEENEEVVDIGGGKEYVIYLVDSAREMLAETEGMSQFQAVMEAIGEDLKRRIIANDYDQAGICFFNTSARQNLHDYDGVYVFFELGQPTAQLIRDVGNLARDFSSIASGMGLGPDSCDHPLFFALSSVQAMLVRSGSNPNLKKVVKIFTNNDDPLENAPSNRIKSDMRKQIAAKAEDMQDYGVEFNLYALSRPGEAFNAMIFYADFLRVSPDQPLDVVCSSLDNLKEQLKKRLMKKRAVRKLRITIGEDIEIGVTSYAMLRVAQKSKAVKVEAKTNTLLKSETTFVCNDTGAALEEVKKSTQFGGTTVVFNPQEIKAVRKLPFKPLQLLGFKPLSLLKVYHNLRPASFLYPDEQSVKGSTSAFIAIHQTMLDQQKFALALYAANSTPTLVALVAQEEELVDSITQKEPPGFHMVYLPWAEDIRYPEKLNVYLGLGDGVKMEEADLDDSRAPRASEDEIQKASQVINRIPLGDVVTVPNPELQTHYAVLQALALEEDEMPTIVDETLPQADLMTRPASENAVLAFKTAVYGEGNEGESAADIRRAEKSAANAKRKEISTAGAVSESAKYDWAKLADEGKLKTLTVVELKIYLEAHKLPLTGKKEILINRIMDHMGK